MNAKTSKNSSVQDPTIDDIPDFDSLGGQELYTDWPIWKAEHCKGKPCVGFVIEELVLAPPKGSPDNRKPWHAYRVLLTKPTIAGHKHGVSEAKLVPAGREVLLVKSIKLDLFKKWAQNPDEMAEIAVVPKEQIKLPNGNEMWTFRQKVLSTKKREAAYRLASPNQVPVQQLDMDPNDFPPED